MRRKDFLVAQGRVLVRRRDMLRQFLAGNTSCLAVDKRSVGDRIDAAMDCEQDELDSQLATAESCELAAIDDALERLSLGEYGTCRVCNRSIPATRLRAIPYATLCVTCQREQERVESHDAIVTKRERRTVSV